MDFEPLLSIAAIVVCELFCPFNDLIMALDVRGHIYFTYKFIFII